MVRSYLMLFNRIRINVTLTHDDKLWFRLVRDGHLRGWGH